ncbi:MULTISPECIES: TM2 domain-containing protein [unclassified Synechococcus]|uniref:TM2 domain-containing protein n=1 Tax=unclassified Synechococcus TaxID=2626047 RepID=UPI000A64B68C|nr:MULTISPECIES: TM2 domain-containing protein [unclassified Synechococcus]
MTADQRILWCFSATSLISRPVIVNLLKAIILWLQMRKEYQHLAKKMSHGEQMVFENEFELRCRQPSLGVVYALLLGWFGFHRFWLNDRNSGIIFLVFSWTLLPALFSIFDALCMRELCTGYNNRLAKQLYDDIKEISPY